MSRSQMSPSRILNKPSYFLVILLSCIGLSQMACQGEIAEIRLTQPTPIQQNDSDGQTAEGTPTTPSLPTRPGGGGGSSRPEIDAPENLTQGYHFICERSELSNPTYFMLNDKNEVVRSFHLTLEHAPNPKLPDAEYDAYFTRSVGLNWVSARRETARLLFESEYYVDGAGFSSGVYLADVDFKTQKGRAQQITQERYRGEHFKSRVPLRYISSPRRSLILQDGKALLPHQGKYVLYDFSRKSHSPALAIDSNLHFNPRNLNSQLVVFDQISAQTGRAVQTVFQRGARQDFVAQAYFTTQPYAGEMTDHYGLQYIDQQWVWLELSGDQVYLLLLKEDQRQPVRVKLSNYGKAKVFPLVLIKKIAKNRLQLVLGVEELVRLANTNYGYDPRVAEFKVVELDIQSKKLTPKATWTYPEDVKSFAKRFWSIQSHPFLLGGLRFAPDQIGIIPILRPGDFWKPYMLKSGKASILANSDCINSRFIKWSGQ